MPKLKSRLAGRSNTLLTVMVTAAITIAVTRVMSAGQPPAAFRGRSDAKALYVSKKPGAVVPLGSVQHSLIPLVPGSSSVGSASAEGRDAGTGGTHMITAQKPFHVASLSRPGLYTIIVFSMNGCPPCDTVWQEARSAVKANRTICAVKVNVSPILKRVQAGSGKQTVEDEIFCNAIWHQESEIGFPSMLVYNPVGVVISDVESGNAAHLTKPDGLFGGATECSAMIAAIQRRASHVPHRLSLAEGTRLVLKELK